MIIRRLGVMSVAKISAVIAAVIGLLAGILFFLVSLAGGASSAMSEDPGAAWISGLGAMAIVVLPIFYGVIGFIGGALQAFVYNIAAKFVGGVRIETE